MANLLPIELAVSQLHSAIKAYQRELTQYENHDYDPSRWNALAAAYSRVSSAQWELEQVRGRE